jgi:hypothetical protein
VKSPDPNWKYGQGVNGGGATLDKKHIEIDPYAEGRPMMSNYKLLISGIVPRPIGFLSTQSVDGKTENLSPMSYFQVVDHDPPMFIVGFSARAGRPKDMCRNLKETGECVYQCGLGEYDASGERHFCRRAVRSLGMGDIRASSST